MWTLEHMLADNFTLPVKGAWTATYLAISGAMENAAEVALLEAA